MTDELQDVVVVGGTDVTGKLRDVLVIGGGPAGSTAATLLARQGHDVVLFEKERFPRDHVGESMLPFCFPLFEDLGVLEELKRTFVRKPGVRFINRDGVGTTSWCFSHVIPDETYLSFQVNRAPFDQILLENSRRNGAEVHEETKVEAIDVSDPEMVVLRTSGPDGEREHRARFLVDASGRDAIVGSRQGWRKPREELDRTALWSHWEGVTMKGGLEEGMSLIIYMGEEKKGWIWVFPLTEDRVTAGVVMNNSYLREQKRLLQERGSTDWMRDLTMQELELSSFVKGLLEGTTQALPIMVNGNYSYEVKNHFGPNYAMVGDARGFIDPIFSSGVFLSIKTSYLATDAIHGLLIGEPDAMDRMAEAYKKVTGAYNFVHRMIKLFYNPHAVTWAEVGEEGEVHRAHQSAMAAGHFMLSGGFFEDHERFNRFFTLLEDPKQFHRYATTVIERADFRDTSCHTPWETAFGDLSREAAATPA
jgi:flavin-dependent dehydrogenase